MNIIQILTFYNLYICFLIRYEYSFNARHNIMLNKSISGHVI